MTTAVDTFDAPEGIAIIGMAGRFPGANHLRQFWQNLCAGVESIAFFSNEELAAAGVPPALLNDPNYVKAAARLEDIEWFDAGFFGYSAKEASVMDPQQRLFLECAWEALEEAGYAPDTYGGSIGVYGGSGTNTYLTSYSHRLGTLDGDVLSTFLSNAVDFLTTRVSYKLNLTGPSLTVQTACSTSLVAVHLACQSLLHGECDMALAGGVSIKVTDSPGYFYQQGGIASPDGHCRAFDARAQGTLFGDGVGIVVLKRIAEAIEDRDHIYAVIRGSAINNDGSSKVGYTAPSVGGQARVIEEALAVAGVAPETIGYIETHGTGTALGDPVEIAALSQAFRASTAKKGFCAISSVKTNIGHLDAAAGIASLIKTALMLHYRALPPSLHFEEPNSEIDFANSPFFVNTKLRQWETPDSAGSLRRAGVSSFGMGGTNAHMVLEEMAEMGEIGEMAEMPDRPLHVLALSAKTESALLALAGRYAQYFDAHPEAVLSDVCFTANAGRVRFPHRLMLRAASVREARQKLAEFLAGRQPVDVARGDSPNGRPKIGFLFSGEESQYAGMGRQLYATQPVFRAAMDRCASLGETPALFAVEYALAELWRSWGIQPDAVMGQGLGEYVAACVAGVFSLEDAIRLIATPAHRIAYRAPLIPMVSGVTGTFLDPEPEIQDGGKFLKNFSSVLNFGLPARGPGRFAAGLEAMRARGVELLVEIGPARSGGPGLLLPSMRQGVDEWEQILSSLGALYVEGAAVDWIGFDGGYPRRRLSLPTYPFERRRYWLETPQRRPAGDPAVAIAVNGAASRHAPQFRQEIEQASAATRMDILRTYLESEIAVVLGVDPDSASIDPHQGFFDMGMESLTALELKSRLEKGVGCSLPSTFSMNYPNVEALAGYIGGHVLGWETTPTIPAAAIAVDDTADAAAVEMEKLSENELAALLDKELDQILGDAGA